MANREACELYIEQEIQSGLDDGKTPYSIGKELSDWVAKLFEVRISPKTLETRAYRQKNTSNEVKNSNDQQQTENIQEIKQKGITDMGKVITRPLCRKCNKRFVVVHPRTKRFALHGLCKKCRADFILSKKAEESLKTGRPNPHHQEIWIKCNLKIKELIDFICEESRIPVMIDESLRIELNDNFSALDSLFKNHLNGEKK